MSNYQFSLDEQIARLDALYVVWQDPEYFPADVADWTRDILDDLEQTHNVALYEHPEPSDKLIVIERVRYCADCNQRLNRNGRTWKHDNTPRAHRECTYASYNAPQPR